MLAFRQHIIAQSMQSGQQVTLSSGQAMLDSQDRNNRSLHKVFSIRLTSRQELIEPAKRVREHVTS